MHVLLDFLHMMHSNKEAEASHIKSHLDMIDRDIQQVLGFASQTPNVLALLLSNVASTSCCRNVSDTPPIHMRVLNCCCPAD